MNIFIKLLCPRKFQQTDRVQPTAPVQIQHEDLLQVTNGVWAARARSVFVSEWTPAEGAYVYSIQSTLDPKNVTRYEHATIGLFEAEGRKKYTSMIRVFDY